MFVELPDILVFKQYMPFQGILSLGFVLQREVKLEKDVTKNSRNVKE